MADELFKTTYLELVLGEMAEVVKAGYIAGLERNGHSASGNLSSTITTQVEHKGTWYEVSLNLQDYWKYVEYDTPPHWPPRDAILKWIAVKGIIPRPDDKGRIPKPESLAFLIGRAMAGESPNQLKLKNPHGGTTGTHDLEKAKEEEIPKWTARLLAALERDSLEYIEKVTAEIETDTAV